jgi:hypothetical protein
VSGTKTEPMISALPYRQTMKRALPITAAVTVLLLISALAAKMLVGTSKPTVITKHSATVKKTVVPWDGAGTVTENVQFSRNSQLITISSIAYTGLNTTTARVIVTMNVNSESSTPARWPGNKNGFVISGDQGSILLTDKHPVISYNGPITNLTLRYKVPVVDLGATCTQTQQYPLAFMMLGPERSPFGIQLVPPAVPAGHCLSETTDPATTTTSSETSPTPGS